MRIGVSVGYLVFILIPIWLEWQDEEKDEFETNCIWYWKTAFGWSVPILLLARGFEFYISRSMRAWKVMLYHTWQDEIEEVDEDHQDHPE